MLRIELIRYGNDGEVAERATGECEHVPVTRQPFRLMRDNGVPLTTTEVRETEARENKSFGSFITIAGVRYEWSVISHPATRRATVA